MTKISWAIITILLLALLWLWKRRKAALLPDLSSGYSRIVSSLVLLIGWSALNLLQNIPNIESILGTTVLILLDSFSTALLPGAILLLVITFLIDFALIRNHGAFRKRSVSFAGLMGEIAGVSVNRGKLAFVEEASAVLAKILSADYYQITKIENDQRVNLGACSIQHGLDVKNGHRFRMPDDGLNSSDREPLCRRHKQICLCLKSNLPEAYELIFLLPKYQRILKKPEFQDILRSVLISKLENAAQNEELKERLDIESRQNRLYLENDRDSDIAAYLQRIYPILSEKVKFDYISVAVLDSAIQNMYRYTYADVGGSLIERGICYPLKQTAALRAAGEARMLVANTLESDFYRDDYHLYKSGFSSRLVYPVRNDSGRVLAVLTLAAVKPKTFNHLDEPDLQFLNAPLCRMIEFNNVSSMMNTLKKQVVSSFNLTFGLENSPGSKGFYDRSAQILAETLPATMCRVWGYDQSLNRLRSIGYHSLHRRTDQISDSRKDVELELMPRHKAAIKMGKAIIVNQSNPESNMGKSEVEFMGLPGIKSAILAPMRLQNRISGIVSVGEVRNWERRSLGQQELLYSQIVSTISALVHEIDSKALELNRVNAVLNEIDKRSLVYETYTDLPSRISSKLSGIMGAAELIRRKMPEDAREMIRYNDIIIKGAETIAKELNRFGELKKSIFRDKAV
ncbi:MAG TPA: GAF domain-containing protein [candidate division Zixibacteria bacterium]|nr:GAF domain-containing protein [candidate division Zixibacteria bacterium]HEQ98197.1 GAF domain-containing protein [candidate division Zixibacteria bacterium]